MCDEEPVACGTAMFEDAGILLEKIDSIVNN